MRVFCLRFCYLHVNWWISFVCWRYESIRFCVFWNLFKVLRFCRLLNFFDYLFELQVFQRERLNGHYGVTAFVISNTLSATPFLILITFLSGTICYFMVQLHPGFSHYVFFVLCLYASVTVVESLMMAIASIVPNFLMGIIIGAGIQVCASSLI